MQHGIVLILKDNGPYKRDSKDRQQEVEDRHNDRGIKAERKN